MFQLTNISDYVNANPPAKDAVNHPTNYKTPIFSSDRTDNGLFDYRFNSYGFRGSEPGEGQLLSVGCSICLGVGVAEEDRTSTVLAKSLGLEDFNLGWPGKSIDYCYRMLNWAVPTFNPKFVFIQSPATRRREHLCSIIGTYDYTAKNPPSKNQEIPPQARTEYNEVFNHFQKSSEQFHDLTYYNYATAIENLLERYQVPWIFLIPKKASDQLASLLEQRSPKYLRLRGSIDFGRDEMHPGIESHKLWADGVLKRHRNEPIPENYLPPQM